MPEAPRRGRGRPPLPPEQQRQRLIDAATRVIRRRDFEGASVQDIVREARMSSRSFYEHFRSKEELVVEMVQAATQTFMARILASFAPELSPEETVDALLQAYLEELAPVVIIDRERLGSGVGERVTAMRAEYYERLLDVVLEQLQAAVEAGVIARVPERVMLDVVLSGIEALTIRFSREGRLEELEAQRKVLGRALLGLVS